MFCSYEYEIWDECGDDAAYMTWRGPMCYAHAAGTGLIDQEQTYDV